MPVLDRLEPFARDLFTEEIGTWLPKSVGLATVSDRRFFGGMYQMLTLKVAEEEKIGTAASN